MCYFPKVLCFFLGVNDIQRPNLDNRGCQLWPDWLLFLHIFDRRNRLFLSEKRGHLRVHDLYLISLVSHLYLFSWVLHICLLKNSSVITHLLWYPKLKQQTKTPSLPQVIQSRRELNVFIVSCFFPNEICLFVVFREFLTKNIETNSCFKIILNNLFLCSYVINLKSS